MYFDFEIDSNGDLVISNEEVLSTARINFALTNTSALRIKFAILSDFEQGMIDDNTLKISFNISNDSKKYAIKVVKEDELLRQSLRIYLNTIKGEILGREYIGSELEKVRYCNINEKNLKTVQAMVQKEIEKIVPSAKAYVSADKGYNGYYNALNITVYNLGELLINYELKR